MRDGYGAGYCIICGAFVLGYSDGMGNVFCDKHKEELQDA